MHNEKSQRAFTLIELSVVLVIIGLIVGGVLVGQDLIRAATVRAQISQIEKFNSAVNTFYGKYQALPGDMNTSIAQTYGFSTRAGTQAFGDGNGVLESAGGGGVVDGFSQATGEMVYFWSDLTYANGMNINLIPGTFYAVSGDIYPTTVNTRLPASPIGRANCLYVWSASGFNYYGLSANCYSELYGVFNSTAGLTVNEAYTIDKKMDDGYPQTGRVIALILSANAGAPFRFAYAAGNGLAGASDQSATSASPTTCFDNDGAQNTPQHYSTEYNGGTAINCGLSFRFQ